MNAALAVETVFHCDLCQDRRKLFSRSLNRMITCPVCTRRPRNDTSGMRALIQNEADRQQIQQARALAAALKHAERISSRVKRLNPQRAPVDRIMQRWSVGEGSGLPYTSDELDMAAQAAAEQADTFAAPPAKSPPLDDETQIIVDRVVIRSPKETKYLIRQWYCSTKAVQVIAADCGVHRSHIYRRWHDALDYLRYRFEIVAHPTLMRLMRSPV